jgi:hypothetical protein
MTTRTRLGTGRDGARGQVLVLFALSLIVLLGVTSVAVDIGRFYGERRFLQNAADAAALAAANALIRGESQDAARAEAMTVITRNYAVPPNGITPSLPPPAGQEVYEPGFAGTPSRLMDGILISSSEVRVAVLNQVNWTFGQVFGFDETDIGARARVTFRGNLLPIAVRRFVNAPGPNGVVATPCTTNFTEFLDFFATADTACYGTDTDGALRMPPNPGAAFSASSPDNDRVNHGPVVVILGQGAQPANGADFRGFIAPDVRNFEYPTSQIYYNGVSDDTSPNQLKNAEADIIARGYYQPNFPPVVDPPDYNLQVGILSGNNTGIAIDMLRRYYEPGDEIQVAVYPGVVMAIPDFTLNVPGGLIVRPNGVDQKAGSIRVARNNRFNGQVILNTLPDSGDPLNPMLDGSLVAQHNNPDPANSPDIIRYDPNPVTPSLGQGSLVGLEGLKTSSAAIGIYTLWIQGVAPSPYLTVKREPIALCVSTSNNCGLRDFTITSNVSVAVAPNMGDTATFTLSLANASSSTPFGAAVNLSVDGPLPTGVGSVSLSSTAITPTSPGTSVSLSIGTGTMAPGRHTFVVRATGMNGDNPPRPVTHLLPLTVEVAPEDAKGRDVYIDLTGFAVMRIVSMTSNFVTAYAITPAIADQNDPRLLRGQVARLVPWN